MSNFDHLPKDIQIKIFNYFEIVDLLECQLTCKHWNKYSAHALYKNIKFNYRNIINADEFIETLKKHGKDLMALVEHVEMRYISDFKRQQKMLLIFFAYKCPNIRTYVGEIVDEPYLGGLNFENWKHLEKFTFSGSDESKQLVEIVKKHKGTIKELELRESVIPTLCNEKENKQEFRKKIAEFKSLEKITIILERSCYLPSLDNMIPENVKSLILNLKGSRVKQETTVLQDIDLREIIPCPNIKELILGIPLNNENSIKYLMHKFPKLEKLSYGREVIISVSENTRDAFTDYLLNIKNSNATYTLVCNSGSPTDYFFIKKLIESSKTKDSKKKRDFTVSFSINKSFINKVQVDKKTNNGVESCKILVGLEELQKLDFLKRFGSELTELDVWRTKDDGLSFSKILMHCPNLSSLEVQEFDSTLDEEPKGNTANLETLEYLGSPEWPKHFPNLTNLIFSGSENIAVDLSSIITAFPNLVTLEMSRVVMKEVTASELIP